MANEFEDELEIYYGNAKLFIGRRKMKDIGMISKIYPIATQLSI